MKFADISFHIDSLSECLMCLWKNQSDFQLGNGYEQWLSVTAGYVVPLSDYLLLLVKYGFPSLIHILTLVAQA